MGYAAPCTYRLREGLSRPNPVNWRVCTVAGAAAIFVAPLLQDGQGETMTIDDFWKLIEQCKDVEYPEVVLADLLDALSVEDLMKFDHYFEWLENYAHREDVWCAAYLLNGGCSDDGFSDFRRGLISKGRSVYELALKNPDSLQALWGQGYVSNESFGCAAYEAYAQKTGISARDAIGVLMRNAYATKFDLYIDGGPARVS